ncbi:MAG: thioether cross-link-forming SCIFF peptide maturase [Methanothrix sp.]
MCSIDIHIMENNGRYVVFHPETFSLFYISKEIGEILKFYENGSKDIHVIAEKFNKKETYIDDILNYIQKKSALNPTKNLEWTNGIPRTLCLIISQDCNLRCAYCYADHGTYMREKRLMDIETARKAIDKLFSYNYLNTILFFGGEPLLNFSLIKEIDSYVMAVGLNVKYTAVTNGTIMNDEMKHFINNKFFNLCISLDGIKEINDQQRYGNVESVHDCVIKTLNELKYRKYPISIKSIITKLGVDRLEEVETYIGCLNIDSTAIEPVNEVQPDSMFYISDEEYVKYVQNLANIFKKYIHELAKGDKLVSYYTVFNIILHMLTRTRKINMCSAGREYLAITAEGDVYPCHRFIGLEEFNMGNVHDNNFPDNRFIKIKNMFNDKSIDNLEKCCICWARYLCGGDCDCDSYIYKKDILYPTERRCLLMKTIINTLMPEIADIFLDETKTKNLLKWYENHLQV